MILGTRHFVCYVKEVIVKFVMHWALGVLQGDACRCTERAPSHSTENIFTIARHVLHVFNVLERFAVGCDGYLLCLQSTDSHYRSCA
jgi:hypothetical protein